MLIAKITGSSKSPLVDTLIDYDYETALSVKLKITL